MRSCNYLRRGLWQIIDSNFFETIDKKIQCLKGIKKIVITENGAAFPDKEENGKVNDTERINYITKYLQQVLRAKQEGYNVHGYFLWSLTF